MKRSLLLIALLAAAPLALAQQVLPQDSKMPPLPPLKNPPLVDPRAAPNTTPNICDQSMSGVLQTAEGHVVGVLSPMIGYAVPWKDAQDNHDKAVTVLNKISQLQNKGGEYTATFTETVNCDKKGNSRIQSGSIYVEGLTLESTTEITDVALQMAKEVNDRFKARAKAGMKTGWNHKNAKPVKYNDAGQFVFESMAVQ